MVHSHIKIWLHLIWSTKNRERKMFDKLAKEIQQHLLMRSKNIGTQFELVQVQPEHIHGLISLPSDMKVAKFMKMIKGETSAWINKQTSLKGKFKWQRGYGAFSISSSKLDKVKAYIQNQKEHHKRRTFKEEYQRWREEYEI